MTIRFAATDRQPLQRFHFVCLIFVSHLSFEANNIGKLYLTHWRGRSASHDDGCLTANVTARVNVTDVPARNALKMTAAPTLRAISNAPCPGSRATSKAGVD